MGLRGKIKLPLLDSPAVRPVLENRGNEANLSERFCSKPFHWAEIDPSGDVYVCCPSWLPLPIGNLKETPLKDILNSSAAQELRNSIMDGSFRHCSREQCPYIQEGILPLRNQDGVDLIVNASTSESDEGYSPKIINACYDRSCNLSCPSCRTSPIHHASQDAVRFNEEVYTYLFGEPHERPLVLNITGSGDPFGSRLFFQTLQRIPENSLSLYPNTRVWLHTNGVGFTTQNWDRIPGVHNILEEVRVSVDAGNPEDYAITRRGGDWNRLMKNLEFIGVLRRTLPNMKEFVIYLVVQKDNFLGIPELIRIAKNVGADSVRLSALMNWGTFSDEDYLEKAVWMKNNPHYSKLLEVLANPIFDDPIASFGSISSAREEAINKRNLRS